MKTLLILTGPQGAGNHLWSKVFAASTNWFSWKDLNSTYWIPHDKEPFANAWRDPSLLKEVDIKNHKLVVTSISCPYAYNKVTIEPNYEEFIKEALTKKFKLKIAVIGRDQNILKFQQQRVRNTVSLPIFEKHLPFLSQFNPIFLSTELLFLYKMHYIKNIEQVLNIPIDIKESHLDRIISVDANTKYFTTADSQPLDEIVKQVSGIK